MISNPDKRSFCKKKIEMSTLLDIIKELYVFEFLDVPEYKLYIFKTVHPVHGANDIIWYRNKSENL